MAATATLIPPGIKKKGNLANVKPDVSEKKPLASSSPKEQPKLIEFYGGRGAYVGADVWYCRHDLAFDEETPRLEILPAKLFNRGLVDPNAWTLSVQMWASSIPDALHDVQFSETPSHGCWCWPVIPQMKQDETIGSSVFIPKDNATASAPATNVPTPVANTQNNELFAKTELNAST